MKRNKIHSSLS